MRRILVVDDEPKILRLIGDMLEEAGYSVERATNGERARELLDSEIFDLLISDVRLPDSGGVALLEHARKVLPRIQVVLITAYGTVTEGVQAMKLGAFDYILKPFEMDALRCLVERALGEIDLREELDVLKADVRRRRGERRIAGSTGAMRGVLELVEKVAPTPSTVLILGESGTGKELVAETIHRLGPSSARPLVRVNCLAIPSELMESELFGHVKGAFTSASESRKGLFEIANGGTLFLDEVADLPLNLQGKLLRALEDHRICRVGSGKEIPVSVRVLAASNVDLKARVDDGRFRDDLYYRLNVFPIHVLPLRERQADIPELVDCLLDEIALRLGRARPPIDTEAVDALRAYRWPGNVRELRNILERACVLAGSGPIASCHLPAELFERPGGASRGCLAEQVDAFRQQVLLDALRSSAWIKKEAAERLGISPRALSHYIGKYGLDRFREIDA
ncbi:MAG: sigma-54-dependent Fis family transcriptional regulator [Deltaproteobacteria bacterium]|nr:sigma-54-dependent Fis family transcriptional regulator [Deltaproteobacteria bacterium]